MVNGSSFKSSQDSLARMSDKVEARVQGVQGQELEN